MSHPQKYVVIQDVERWVSSPKPRGPMRVHKLDRVTEKCVFTQHGYVIRMTECYKKSTIRYRVFDTESEAESFVKVAKENSDIDRIEQAMKTAKVAYENATQEWKNAWTEAGEFAWPNQT